MNYTLRFNSLNKKFYWPIVIIAAIQKFIPPEMFITINVVWLIYLLISSGKVELNSVWGIWTLYIMVVMGIAVGSTTLPYTHYREFLRDVYYYINPIIIILNGTFYAKLGMNYTKYCNSLILGGMVPVLAFYINMARGMDPGGVSGYIWVQLIVLLLGNFDERIAINKFVRTVLLGIMIVSIVVGFSRTAILIVVFGYFFGSIKDTDFIKILKTFITITLIFCLGYLVFNNMLPTEDRDRYAKKIEGSFEEINPNLNWNDPMVITGHWRGYETHCAIEEYKEGNPLELIIGYGFGKRIRVGKYSYLLLLQMTPDGKPAEDIAVTHNGYANVLVKLGMFGIILLLVFYGNLFVKSLDYNKKYNSMEARILAGLIIALAIETIFLNGLFKDSCYYSLVTSIGYFGYRIKNKKDLIENARKS